MANIHTAADPAGKIHTRTSRDRTYTHLIVGLPSYTDALRYAQNHQASKSDFDYYTAKLTEAGAWPQAVEHCRQRLAGHTNFEAWAAAEKADHLARVEARKAEGYYNTWQPLAWAGSLRLAQNQVNAHHKPCWADVQMVPATITVKEPKAKAVVA
jgi:hypothetical protein